LMLAHFCEVLVWSVAYAVADVAPAGADPVYFAFVNYTTLGYGDIIPVKRWQLLGPMTAMNGWLLFGWSTAVIFEILRRTVRRISSGMALGDGSTVESARPAPIGMCAAINSCTGCWLINVACACADSFAGRRIHSAGRSRRSRRLPP